MHSRSIVACSCGAPDGVTSRYSLVVGGKSYLFGPDNAHVTVDRTTFTFNPISGGVYTVTYSSVDSPVENEAPTPIPLTPFSIVAGGLSTSIFARWPSVTGKSKRKIKIRKQK